MRKKGERLPEVSPAKVPRLFRLRAKLFKIFKFLLVFYIRPGGDNFLMGGTLTVVEDLLTFESLFKLPSPANLKSTKILENLQSF